MGAGASSQWQADPAISGIGALTNSGKEQGLAPAGTPLSRHGSTKQDKGGSDNGKVGELLAFGLPVISAEPYASRTILV